MMSGKKILMLPFVLTLMFLTACSSFNGLRQPLYDGETIAPDEKAIAAYQDSGEIIGAEKEYYVRHPFSQDLYQASLDYPDADPELLTAGSYTIGEDLPAGRATLLGNESVFSSENMEAHVGNFIIYDEAGDIYFENIFHADYGPLTAQVDLLPGHTIEIIGEEPEITVFYEPTLPENPYQLMEPPELLVNLDELGVQQPIVQNEENETIRLAAGIYEVGEQIEPGTYDITNVFAVHNTEMYLFREGEEVRVFELLVDSGPNPRGNSGEGPKQIELQAGDKIYPNLVHFLGLKQMQR